MSLAEPLDYECRFLTTAYSEDSSATDAFIERAEGRKGTDERFVFAFRHADKDSSQGLSPIGQREAHLARDYLSDLWNEVDRIPTVFQMNYRHPRVKQTRKRILPGQPYTPDDIKMRKEDKKPNLEGWLDTHFNELFPEDKGNTFVFVNSTAINTLNCGGNAVCKISCLEGVAIEFEKKDGVRTNRILNCFRFFPHEWANLAIANDPEWVDPEWVSEPTHPECKGTRPK
jgi:hypothetical protein